MGLPSVPCATRSLLQTGLPENIISDKPETFQEKVLHFVTRNWLFVTMTAVLLIIALVISVDAAVNRAEKDEHQQALEPFYTPPVPAAAEAPGRIVRSEPLDVAVPADGQGYRILYLSERSDGSRLAVSGMVFIPAGDPPEGGRPVVAWAHPTVGMGDECAPSRAENPLSGMSWLEEMLKRGWVVTATDYAGLGTPGTEHYLVGRDEARDVINSVRAARNIETASASNNFAVWGHSQGGHAALFATLEAASYAPELNLVATAAAAPAAELGALMSEQYKSEVGWVIGPEVLVSWPEVYTGLSREDVATSSGLKKYEGIADECVISAGESALVRSELREDFFKLDPMTLQGWFDAATSETPAMPGGTKPLLVIQGLEDKVVLPETTALFIQNTCKAGVDLTILWLGGTGHMQAARVGGPAAVSWLDDRFHGKPTSPTCDQPLPVEPAQPPRAPAAS